MNKKILAVLISLFSSVSVYAESQKENINLLNKIGYGVTEKSLEILKKEGRINWLKNQLNNPNFYNDKDIESRYDFPTEKSEMFNFIKQYDYFLNQTYLQKPSDSKLYMESGIVTKSLNKRIDYALNSENRLREMMVWFWFNHFNIGVYTNNISALFLNDYEDKIRKNSLGNFKDLLTMVSHHPAMLNYLGYLQSEVGKPSLRRI